MTSEAASCLISSTNLKPPRFQFITGFSSMSAVEALAARVCIWYFCAYEKGLMAKYRHVLVYIKRWKHMLRVHLFPFCKFPACIFAATWAAAATVSTGSDFDLPRPNKLFTTLHISANSIAFHIKGLGRSRWRRLWRFVLASALSFALGLVRFQPRIFEVVFFLCAHGTSVVHCHKKKRKQETKSRTI